tara:strand:+ start:2375 stop:3880 length:1506 start_codon:yes stop_codon:yes gene_type:complete
MNIILHNKIDNLLEEYKENKYILNRLTNYIENTLPSLLENANKNNTEREKRKEELITISDEFINTFLLVNNYYYCSQNELFLYYDKLHFIADSEDNILHKVITSLNNNTHLMQWKHKIKINIIKRIKDKSPLYTIPESKTIQFVIKFFLSIFTSRNHVKYFLTVLGDIIHGKSENIYICSSALKYILNELNIQLNTYIGSYNIFNNIKYKIHDHDLKKCRILYNNDSTNKINIPEYFSKFVVDIICVSSHYSMRYKSSDNFLNQCNENNLIEHSYYLFKNSTDNIIDNFIEKSITTCENSVITNKNMLFIWKAFLKEKNLPNILFHETLINILKTKLNYENTTFINITSMILPIVVDFKNYWDKNIYEGDDTYEIDELCRLFKNKNKRYSDMDDLFFLELIRHLYPNILIDNDKFIIGIKCNDWNKEQEVNDYIILFKNDYNDTDNISVNKVKSVSDIYEYYLTNNKNNLIISKLYFEKTAKLVLKMNIDKYGIINKTWFI